MPCLRQCANMISCSAREIIQPVGLLGEFKNKALVLGVRAWSKRSRLSSQVGCAELAFNSNGTEITSAPRILGISIKLGHNGVTATTLSLGLINNCAINMSAETPEELTAM